MNWRWSVALFLPALATAQGTCHGIRFIGDTKIAYSTISEGPGDLCGATVVDGSVIHRVLQDGSKKPYFGFDIHITPGREAGTYRVEITRPAGSNLISFPKMPDPVTVGNGDRIDLPVLQNPRTGARVLDSFAIAGRGFQVETMPNLHAIPQDPPAGALLTLERPALTTPVSDLGSNPQFGVTGPVVWVYSERLGRILFSATPRPGYRSQGWAEGARIRFVEDVETYTLRLQADAIAQPGTWRLWIKREPLFRPSAGPWTSQELHRGLLAIGAER